MCLRLACLALVRPRTSARHAGLGGAGGARRPALHRALPALSLASVGGCNSGSQPTSPAAADWDVCLGLGVAGEQLLEAMGVRSHLWGVPSASVRDPRPSGPAGRVAGPGRLRRAHVRRRGEERSGYDGAMPERNEPQRKERASAEGGCAGGWS